MRSDRRMKGQRLGVTDIQQTQNHLQGILLRSLAPFPLLVLALHTTNTFMLLSSVIYLSFGMLFFSGVRKKIWEHS